MNRKYQIVVFAVILMSKLMVGSPVDAQNVFIKTSPKTTKIDIYQESESQPKQIALTTETIDEPGLSFKWNLVGPGELKGPLTNPGIFYIPPNNLSSPAEQTTVTVEVTDNKGRKMTASITFVLARKEVPPPPQIRIRAVQLKENNTIMNPTYIINPGATISIETEVTKPEERNIKVDCSVISGKVNVDEQQITYIAPNTHGEIDMITLKAIDTDTNEVVFQKLIVIQLN